jgi:hypothetical protein
MRLAPVPAIRNEFFHALVANPEKIRENVTFLYSWASVSRKLTPASAFQHPEF